TTSASKYPFYVELESSENLLMGQHVYIEPDLGQGAQKEGIWLPSAYLMMEEEKAFVYAANTWGKIEKRSVELGEYDETADSYEILKGVDLEDRIAFPEDFIKAGMGVTDAPSYGGEDNLPDNTLPGEDGMLPDGGEDGIMPRSDAALEE
ncbi:MAG: efflux RND transporter periplasmic adaptor subunit, partial [Clostridiales bacterium]|nr:efflux RND transporter periplasmic adaptor subunit [Clostridiales bacterium]